MIVDDLKASFILNKQRSPILVKSPGRINLIGEHTDYNEGFVLPASIEKAIYFAIQKNDEKSISVETFLTDAEKIEFDLKGNPKPFKAFWGNYFKAILEIMIAKGYTLDGFDCTFGGDIPIGSGLSSSAALCCGFIFAVSKVLGFTISREENALIAQAAEHKIGLNCGLMDQYAVLFGKQGNALFLDCKDLTYDLIPIHLSGYSWVLINSNIKHNLAVDSEYNKRRVSCETVVKKVNESIQPATSLRDVTLEHLDRIRTEVHPTDYKRAKYVLEENERVNKMISALKADDAQLVGSILFQGHWAMSNEYEISTPELDFLVRIAEKLDGVLGSRMMGGGFGGCTINLVQTDQTESCLTKIKKAYHEETNIVCETYPLKIGDGVHIQS